PLFAPSAQSGKPQGGDRPQKGNAGGEGIKQRVGRATVAPHGEYVAHDVIDQREDKLEGRMAPGSDDAFGQRIGTGRHGDGVDGNMAFVGAGEGGGMRHRHFRSPFCKEARPWPFVTMRGGRATVSGYRRNVVLVSHGHAFVRCQTKAWNLLSSMA